MKTITLFSIYVVFKFLVWWFGYIDFLTDAGSRYIVYFQDDIELKGSFSVDFKELTSDPGNYERVYLLEI